MKVLEWKSITNRFSQNLFLNLLMSSESSRKTSISALLTMPKPLTVWITINWKIPKEMGIPDHLTCLLRNLYAGQEATVRTEKEYVKAVYCHPTYLTYMQSTSVLVWKKHKLESRLAGEISVTSDILVASFLKG